MSRIYWDTMLFIYHLEDYEPYATRIRSIYKRMLLRGDVLCTSFLSLGEALAGARRSPQHEQAIREGFEAMEVRLLPFDGGAVNTFASLRSRQKLATTDSIHLACAAAHGIDLFITGDKQLSRQIVPGIQFISSIEGSPI